MNSFAESELDVYDGLPFRIVITQCEDHAFEVFFTDVVSTAAACASICVLYIFVMVH